jgi:hypothetical protein
MQFVLGSAVFVCLAVGAALLLIFRRLVAGCKNLPVSVDWISDLSAARYRPMQRLLQEEDYAFLASQPGCDRRLVRRFRAQRRKLFRRYLSCLTRDFSRVCGALRLLMVHSPTDRPDLAVILYKQQALFAFGLLAVQWHLALHACGIGSVDVRGLVRAMEYMRLELREMVPVPSVAAA